MMIPFLIKNKTSDPCSEAAPSQNIQQETVTQRFSSTLFGISDSVFTMAEGDNSLFNCVVQSIAADCVRVVIRELVDVDFNKVLDTPPFNLLDDAFLGCFTLDIKKYEGITSIAVALKYSRPAPTPLKYWLKTGDNITEGYILEEHKTDRIFRELKLGDVIPEELAIDIRVKTLDAMVHSENPVTHVDDFMEALEENEDYLKGPDAIPGDFSRVSKQCYNFVMVTNWFCGYLADRKDLKRIPEIPSMDMAIELLSSMIQHGNVMPLILQEITQAYCILNVRIPTVVMVFSMANELKMYDLMLVCLEIFNENDRKSIPGLDEKLSGKDWVHIYDFCKRGKFNRPDAM